MLERVETPWYTIHVDKSTDGDNKATMLGLGQYILQEDVHTIGYGPFRCQPKPQLQNYPSF